MAFQPESKLSRREAFRFAGLAAAGVGLAQWIPAAAFSSVVSQGSQPTADEALRMLLEGNQRWVTGTTMHPNQSIERRTQVASGQAPWAIVFSCIDSRVPAELVFDQGLSDMFSIRTAAQVIDSAALGSIEYGVEEYHVPLIVVMGHQRCGAVVATVEAVEHDAHAPGAIDMIVNSIRPAVVQAAMMEGDKVENTVRQNTILTVEALKASGPILSEHVAHGDLKIVGARYDLGTGMVEIIA